MPVIVAIQKSTLCFLEKDNWQAASIQQLKVPQILAGILLGTMLTTDYFISSVVTSPCRYKIGQDVYYFIAILQQLHFILTTFKVVWVFSINPSLYFRRARE